MPRLTSAPLTQKIIDATRPPKTGFTPLRDPGLPGLLLRIWASGARIWSLEYRSPITAKNMRLGLELPDGSLIEARARARELRTVVARGRDPALEAQQALLARQAAHSAVVTVADALGRYEDAVVKTAARTVSRRERMASLRKAVEPFNGAPVASLKREAIVLRLDEIQATRGPIARNRAQSEIRVWQTWMRNRGLVPTIELDRVRKEVKERLRERVLTDLELTVLMREATDRTPFSDIIRVLMHTGMRRGEAASLQARDLDFNAATIRVRSEVSKTRQSRLIPMDDAIAAMLRERAERVGREDYIFGDGSDYRRPFSGWGKRVAALVRVMPVGEPWTLHDIRRTVATRLYEAGTDVLTVEDLLGHTSGARRGVAGTYNRAETLERQRPALRAWAAKLATFVETAEGERKADTGQNVVNLRKAR
jgi:integrase